jgi:hypothetical protein
MKKLDFWLDCYVCSGLILVTILVISAWLKAIIIDESPEPELSIGAIVLPLLVSVCLYLYKKLKFPGGAGDGSSKDK